MSRKEILIDLGEKYDKATKLNWEDSKIDPETDPYKSKYAAREILLEMNSIVKDMQNQSGDDPKDKMRLLGITALTLVESGAISCDVEELSTGRLYLEQCRDLLEEYLLDPSVVTLSLTMFNQLGIITSKVEPEKSLEYLNKAKELYTEYKETSKTPLHPRNLFSIDDQSNDDFAWKHFEQIHTHTLYYLAQVYGTLKNTTLSSYYCHTTLKRQLEGRDFEPDVEWALNSATLSQFFLERSDFKNARHHLAASSYVLDKVEEILTKNVEENEVYEAKVENFKHRSADIARCWAKYGLLLLEKSKERLMGEEDEPKLPEEPIDYTFSPIDLSRYESEVTCNFVLTASDARGVFSSIQKWLNKAETYYNLDNFASDYTEIAQDKSQMYLNLLFFEDDPQVQAKLHKRRIDLLEEVVKNLNPQYYLNNCRLIWYELAQTYSSILDIKSDQLRESQTRPTPHNLSKINNLIDKSIANYQKYMDSIPFKEGEPLDNISEIPYLKALFYVGALNGKFVSLDPNVQFERTKISYECYKKVVDYGQVNEKIKEVMIMEFGICDEMVKLLPVKLAQLEIKKRNCTNSTQ